MKRVLAFLSAALLLFSYGCGTRLDKTSNFLKYKDKEATAAIAQKVESFYTENNLAGISVGILSNGRVKFFSFGQTEKDGAPISEETRFDLGSLSQVFSGVTLGESIFRRYLTPQSKLTAIFPFTTLPTWEGESITINNLATHTSGLARVPDNLPQSDNPYQNYDEMALRRFLSKAALSAEPGTEYQGDSVDMGILGFAVATARKNTFEAQMKNVVTVQAGMTRTTITFPEESDAHLASWATPHSADGKPLEHMEYSALEGAFGVKSTAYDMLLFAWAGMDMPGTEKTFTKSEAVGRTMEQQLYTPAAAAGTPEQEITIATLKVTSNLERLHASMAVATDVHFDNGEIKLGYGFIIDELLGQKYIYQTGGDRGNGGYMGFVPGTKTAVVVLTNTSADVSALGLEIISLLQK